MNKKYTKEKCYNEALKYKYKNEFKKHASAYYYASLRNNWLIDISSHMENKHEMWTKDKCFNEALKYNKKKDFEINNKNCYYAALRNNWIDDICSHMGHFGNIYKRLIYAYEFSDNSVYVGLTSNERRRHNEHMLGNRNNSPVYNHMIKNNITPIKIIYSDYIDAKDAQELENFYINYYKNNNWILLNTAKSGSLGGIDLFWTYDKCQNEAIKYESRISFCLGSSGAYNSARKNKWLDEICKHMIKLRKPTGYWNIKKHCIDEAKKYNKKYLFGKYSYGAYNSARKNKWLDEICKHMV